MVSLGEMYVLSIKKKKKKTLKTMKQFIGKKMLLLWWKTL